MHAVGDSRRSLQSQVVEIHGGASKASRLCKLTNRISPSNKARSLFARLSPLTISVENISSSDAQPGAGKRSGGGVEQLECGSGAMCWVRLTTVGASIVGK